MKRVHLNRLKKLAKYLETVPPEQFDIRNWRRKTECGTTACAIGHACTIPSFRRAGSERMKWLISEKERAKLAEV